MLYFIFAETEAFENPPGKSVCSLSPSLGLWAGLRIAGNYGASKKAAHERRQL